MLEAEAWVRDRRTKSAGPKTERVLQLIATQPGFMSYASAAAAAERAGVDAATVVRAARGLGFSGWPECRLELRNRYLASLNAAQVQDEHGTDASNPVTRAIHSDMAQLGILARTVDIAAIHNVALAITNARRTIVIGSGAFTGPAYELAHVAAFSGLDIEFIGRGGTTLTNALARLQPGDCLVAFNFWRLIREVYTATEIAYEAGATTCLITDLREQPITSVATHLVTVPCEGTSHFPSLTPATAVVHGILSDIALNLADRAPKTMTTIEALWQRMNILY